MQSYIVRVTECDAWLTHQSVLCLCIDRKRADKNVQGEKTAEVVTITTSFTFEHGSFSQLRTIYDWMDGNS